MQFLKQSTQVVVTVGPFVDVGDGFTPQIDISLSTADEAELLKHASTSVVSMSAATWVPVASCRGYYSLTLTTSATDTVGLLTIIVQDDSDCLPVRQDYMVVNANVYDSLYAAATTDYLQVDGLQLGGSTQSATDLKDFADAGYDPATNKVQGVVLCDTITTYTGNTKQTGDVTTAINDLANGTDGLGAIKAETALILADTADIQPNYATSAAQTTAQNDLDTIKAETALILDDTADIQLNYATSAELAKVPKSDSTVTWNATALASINTQADLALSDYDPPTKDEMDTAHGLLATPAQVATALTDIHLDHLLAATYDATSKPGAADALLNELVEDDSGVTRYTVNALENGPSGSGASAEAIADAVWDEVQSGHTDAGSFGKYLDTEVSGVGGGSGLSPLLSGTAQAGSTSSTIKLAAATSLVDGTLNGTVINLLTGTGASQSRYIAGWTSVGDVADITPNWTTTPDATTTYEVVQGSCDAVRLEGNDPSDLINSACDAAIVTYNLDHLMLTPVANNADMTTEVADGTVMSNVLSATSDTSTYVVADDSLQGISEGAAGGGATAEDVRIEMDSNSTQLAAIVEDTGTTIPGTITTMQGNVTDILTDTGTTIPGTITTMQGNVTDILTDTGTTIPAMITTAQNDLNILTGPDGVILATTQGNYAPALASSFTFTTAGVVDANTERVNNYALQGDGTLGNEWGPA